jgi:hypothetical protein
MRRRIHVNMRRRIHVVSTSACFMLAGLRRIAVI